jgi:hypothetical protein
MTDDRHGFRLKGEFAERIVHELAGASFFTDWCYRNPKLADGKELCDLLIETPRVWQRPRVEIAPRICCPIESPAPQCATEQLADTVGCGSLGAAIEPAVGVHRNLPPSELDKLIFGLETHLTLA